jgi:hypothetical protein
LEEAVTKALEAETDIDAAIKARLESLGFSVTKMKISGNWAHSSIRVTTTFCIAEPEDMCVPMDVCEDYEEVEAKAEEVEVKAKKVEADKVEAEEE